MKTIRELYKEIVASDGLKAAFLDAVKDGKTADFLKAHGCEATEAEITAFLKEQAAGELSDEELDDASGGTCNDKTKYEALFSTFSAGIGCVTIAIYSCMAAGDGEAHMGQQTETDGRICNEHGAY